MKTMKFFKMISFMVLFVTVCSCKKEKTEPTPSSSQKTKKDFLQEGKWQVSDLHSVFIDSGNVAGEANYADLDSCSKDDFLLFKPNGVIYVNGGSFICDSTLQVDSSGTWALSEDFTQLTFTQDISGVKKSRVYTVLMLTSALAKLSIVQHYTSQTLSYDTVTVKNIN